MANNMIASDFLKRLDANHAEIETQEEWEKRILLEIMEITRRITEQDFRSILERIIAFIKEETGAEKGFVMLCDKGGRLKVLAGTLNPLPDEQNLEMSRSIACEAVKQGKSILIDNIEAAARYTGKRSVEEYHIRSVMCVPIRIKGEIPGVLYLDSRKENRNFSKKGLIFFEAFASQAAIAIENAGAIDKIKKENRLLRLENQGRMAEVVCKSRAMKNVLAECSRILDNAYTVLLSGETGTGKDVLARYIHYNSIRRDNPFIPVNCSAFNDELSRSELFGYIKGAFSGADRDHDGLFKAADKGTLFLDEINKTTLKFQQALLLVLENKTITPVGATRPIPVDVRVLAATNTDLEKEVEKGNFLEDLFYRLDMYHIIIPPLRNRPEDIPLLANHFIKHYNNELGKDIAPLSAEFIQHLTNQLWPGNIRQLKHYLLKSILKCENRILIPEIKNSDRDTKPENNSVYPGNLSPLYEVEKAHILKVLEHTRCNVTRAARILKMPKSTLQSRIKKFSITCVKQHF